MQKTVQPSGVLDVPPGSWRLPDAVPTLRREASELGVIYQRECVRFY